uniref:small monomeric GTPase n=1 Tax=Gallus gallus TaxID=9031 RepID=A0A8V0YDG9_CHICK
MELENEMISSSSNSSAGSREYKVVMLGAGGVGKSAMTMQFISHRFPDYHDPTIEDAYKTQVRIDDEPAYLDILDTAGQAEFTAMRDQYMRGGEGFIICYSITDRQSFQEAAEFKELIYRVRHTYDIPLVLVGNKTDLEEFRQSTLGAFRKYKIAAQKKLKKRKRKRKTKKRKKKKRKKKKKTYNFLLIIFEVLGNVILPLSL